MPTEFVANSHNARATQNLQGPGLEIKKKPPALKIDIKQLGVAMGIPALSSYSLGLIYVELIEFFVIVRFQCRGNESKESTKQRWMPFFLYLSR